MKKLSLAAALGLGLAIGLITGSGSGLLTTQAADVVVEPGWRYADGYWNYWDADDRTWYYTDGRHWYGYGDTGWAPYKFDKNFGRKVYREGYTVPLPGGDIVIPNHKIKIKVK
jgi:hypothetical protein